MTSNQKEEELYKYVKGHYWSKFRRNTTILSSTCRQLALGIGGLSWAEKKNMSLHCLPKAILILVFFFFVIDAFQYLYQSCRYHLLASKYDNEIKCKNIKEISELTEELGINSLTNAFFVMKLIVLLIASILFIILIFNI